MACRRTLGIVLLCCVRAFAWGSEGHRLVARIAESRLSPEARARVSASLRPDESLQSVASWADDYRNSHRETEPWHYVDIPISRPHLDMQRDCPGGDCIIGKIEEFRTVWRGNGSPESRRDALRFLVHFVGDLHEPLHAEDNGDKGGNDVPVEFLGRGMNLHRVWDSGVLDSMAPEEQLAMMLLGGIDAERAAAWSRGTVEDWAEESFQVARQIYAQLPNRQGNEALILGESYARTAEPIIETQIEKAGVRLAAILNEMP